MSLLIDSNVLVFSVWKDHPRQAPSVASMQELLSRGVPMYAFPQNMAEFWNVCTRPRTANGLGLEPIEADSKLRALEADLTILYESAESYAIWRELLVEQSVRGVQVHDARLAAGMLRYGITRVLTYNPRDFGRFGVQCVTPEELLASL